MEASQDLFDRPNPPLQFLLFIDNRPRTKGQVQEVQSVLESLAGNCGFQLEVINVTEQPHLTEHYKLIATPALIRLQPTPQQVLAGTDLAAQIEHWWPRWQSLLEEQQEDHADVLESGVPVAGDPLSVDASVQMLQLSDEVFRLHREKEDLKAQLHFQDRIIAILAHDLRNPLTAASLAIDTLALGCDAEDSRSACLTPALSQQLLQQARTQLRKIDHMVTDILQAARGGGSQLQIQPSKLDLDPLCQDSIYQLQDRWLSKTQTLKTDIPTDLPAVYADPERIRQVFVNLLDNAIKYTPNNGIIQVSILHRTAQKVQVSICDTGPGIPEEKQDQIFEDSFRLQRDENLDGYGIGLAVCQRIIRSHYGQIWVDSVLDQGSCFHFTLPVYPYD
jgi:two-component system clock-associated histidine kinase SasA